MGKLVSNATNENDYNGGMIFSEKREVFSCPPRQQYSGIASQEPLTALSHFCSSKRLGFMASRFMNRTTAVGTKADSRRRKRDLVNGKLVTIRTSDYKRRTHEHDPLRRLLVFIVHPIVVERHVGRKWEAPCESSPMLWFFFQPAVRFSSVQLGKRPAVRGGMELF